MFGKKTVVEMITRSTDNQNDRRSFLKAAGLTGVGVVGGSTVMGLNAPVAEANEINDVAVLNFALQLEYLEAEYYQIGAFGRSLRASEVDGRGSIGRVTGGRQVTFRTRRVREYAQEIATDERDHVRFLRSALGSARTARPNINLRESFTAAARAAGLINSRQTFDPFANEDNFMLGAYIFEDVGVTAYKGAAPLVNNKVFLEAAAGILAVEAYHAGTVRTVLLQKGLQDAANAISNARDSLDGPTDLDQGITTSGGRANIVPADANAIAFSRTPGQVLNIVYLNPGQVSQGGFFPNSVNGTLRVSDNNA